MTTIKFINVGRGKRNWEAKINTDMPEDAVCGEIAREIKANGGLISRDVHIDYTEDWKGRIYAGFHKVGEFEPA